MGWALKCCAFAVRPGPVAYECPPPYTERCHPSHRPREAGINRSASGLRLRAGDQMLSRRQSPDPSTFAAEVLTHLESLYGTAMRLTRNKADAEDLVQDTLVRAFRSADRFAAGTNLKAWLYTILHNAWRNRRRDAAHDPLQGDSERIENVTVLPDGAAEPDTPERVLMRDTLDADLQAALDRLPDAFRQAVWLRDV